MNGGGTRGSWINDWGVDGARWPGDHPRDRVCLHLQPPLLAPGEATGTRSLLRDRSPRCAGNHREQSASMFETTHPPTPGVPAMGAEHSPCPLDMLVSNVVTTPQPPGVRSLSLSVCSPSGMNGGSWVAAGLPRMDGAFLAALKSTPPFWGDPGGPKEPLGMLNPFPRTYCRMKGNYMGVGDPRLPENVGEAEAMIDGVSGVIFSTLLLKTSNNLLRNDLTSLSSTLAHKKAYGRININH